MKAARTPVGRQADNGSVMGQRQFPCDLTGGAGHAAEPEIAGEECLIGDLGDRPAGSRPLDPFLRLDQLVQALLPLPIGHDPARELIDDGDPVLRQDVVLVALVEMQRVERLDQALPTRRQRSQRLAWRRKSGDPPFARTGQPQCSLAPVQDEVASLQEKPRRGEEGRRVGLIGLASGFSRDDEGRLGLIDQNRIHLVDDREAEAARQSGRAGIAAGKGGGGQ